MEIRHSWRVFAVCLIAITVALTAGAVAPQEIPEEYEHENILDRMQGGGESCMEVEMSEDLKGLLDYFVPHVVNKKPGKKAVKKRNQGFRIQVFSDSSNPSTLRARAGARANAILARFPQFRGQVYPKREGMRQICRIGNFETRQEASNAARRISAAFPQFGGEITVVPSTIVYR